MKRLAVVLFLIMLGCGCGNNARWKSLPVGVYTDNELLKSMLDEAVESFNWGFGKGKEIFISGNNIQVLCVKTKELSGFNGYCNYEYGMDETIDYAVVRIACDNFENQPRQYLVNVIAHELYHCLGFDHHHENSWCVSYEHINGCSFEHLTCDEVKLDISVKYPEF